MVRALEFLFSPGRVAIDTVMALVRAANVFAVIGLGAREVRRRKEGSCCNLFCVGLGAYPRGKVAGRDAFLSPEA